MVIHIRKVLYDMLEAKHSQSFAGQVLRWTLSVLIILNIIAVVLESLPDLPADLRALFYVFELISVMIFTVEYFTRLWISVEGNPIRPFWSRIEFIFSFQGLIDLVAIVPFYIPIFVTVDFRFLRAFRLARLVRALKLGRYSNAVKVLTSVVKEKSPELILTIFFAFIVLLVAASGMYFFERDAQSEAFSSIPAAMWWAVATLTTVGYGDVYPVTVGGKLFGALIAVFGVGMVAAPAGILGAGLLEVTKKQEEAIKLCPRCHYKFDNEVADINETTLKSKKIV